MCHSKVGRVPPDARADGRGDAGGFIQQPQRAHHERLVVAGGRHAGGQLQGRQNVRQGRCQRRLLHRIGLVVHGGCEAHRDDAAGQRAHCLRRCGDSGARQCRGDLRRHVGQHLHGFQAGALPQDVRQRGEGRRLQPRRCILL